MKPVILVTGKDGQVGRALGPALALLGELVAVGRGDCNFEDTDAIARLVQRLNPSIIVNSAAYTAVEKAESDSTAAFAVNASAPGVLATLAKNLDIPLIHYSTDYVYDGKKSSPYVESDPTGPLSVYGASKLEGENAIRAAHHRHVILRTSWVFGNHGPNFLKTMLRLLQERDTLNVVADQFGAPTSARLIAAVTAGILEKMLSGDRPWGTYHLAAAGETSWFGFANLIAERARVLAFPVKTATINPIPANAYPALAVRPANSRLDTAKLRAEFALNLPMWQDDVIQVMENLAPA